MVFSIKNIGLITLLILLVAKTNSETATLEELSSFLRQPLLNFESFEATIRAKLPKDANIKNTAIKILEMFDASTKTPSGLLTGKFFYLGHFDECYKIEFGKVTGKYCLAEFPLPTSWISALSNKTIKTTLNPIFGVQPQPRMISLGTEYIGLFLAVCGLSSMSAEEINMFVPLLKVNEFMCYSKEKEPDLTTGAIATISLFAIVSGLAIVSTVYDVVLHYQKKKPMHQLLVAFSWLTNGRKILTVSTNPDQLLCFNGIKAISMMWVVLGHEYVNVLSAPVSNTLYILKEWEQKLSSMLIMGATVSVDTFFVVGGIVTVYTYLKATNKGVKFNIIMFYIHRFLRLTPAFGAVILVYANLLQYIPAAPSSAVITRALVNPCQNDWWKALFYIGNFFTEGGCVGQGWYLSTDFQLFLLSPLILLPMVKYPKATNIVLRFLIVMGCVAPFVVAYVIPVGAMLRDPHFYQNYYQQPYARFGPYVLGMLVGQYIYQIKQRKEKIQLSPVIVCLLWVGALIVMMTCVYAPHDIFLDPHPPLLENSVYLALNRTAWAVAVSIVILLCVSGYGGLVDGFLSLPIFQIITKLSYSIYLVHYGLIVVRFSSLKLPFKFSNLFIMHIFWSDFIFTIFLSVFLCLLFESPIIILEKFIFKPFNLLSRRK